VTRAQPVCAVRSPNRGNCGVPKIVSLSVRDGAAMEEARSPAPRPSMVATERPPATRDRLPGSWWRLCGSGGWGKRQPASRQAVGANLMAPHLPRTLLRIPDPRSFAREPAASGVVRAMSRMTAPGKSDNQAHPDSPVGCRLKPSPCPSGAKFAATTAVMVHDSVRVLGGLHRSGSSAARRLSLGPRSHIQRPIPGPSS
jgi:hypothetical protein